MRYVGDYTPGKTVYVDFNTHQTTGTPITLAGTPAVSVYKRGSTTESTTGVTLSVDYDSRTGYHLVTVDTGEDGTFYSAGSDFSVVVTAGTVDGTSVVGTTVGFFSLSNRSALRPSTADQTLDAQNLNTLITDYGNAELNCHVLGVSGDVEGKVLGGGAGTITGTGVRAVDGSGNAIAPAATALSTADWTNTRAGYLDNLSGGAVALQSTLSTVAGYVDTEVAAIKAKTDNLPTDPADASDIAAAFTTVNTTLATIAAYIDTEVAAIKAKTDNLPSDPADASDIAASFSSLASTLSTIAGYIDTEVAAIKTKTDQLAFTTANRVDCQVFGLENNTITAAALAADAGTEIATAVTAKDLGNGRTVAYYLKGGANKIVFASNGLSFTVYDTDDTTTLYTGTSTRLATSVGGLLSIDPS